MVTREICKICYHPITVGFSVPDHVWNEVVPEHLQGSTVCLACFTRLGDEKEVAWDLGMECFPVSAVTHRRPWLSRLDRK